MRGRIKYIDIVKGISIICIVLLHFEDGLFPQQLNIFIGSFMISMFYIVSGWIDALHHEHCTPKELIKKTVETTWYTLYIVDNHNSCI